MSIRQIIIAALVMCLPLLGFAQESEEELNKAALELFDAENYEDAFSKYSQLLSLQLQSPEYNFRFGACQLFTSQDKEEALKYLKFAVDAKEQPNLAHFYYALGLHLNYRFEKAIKEYEVYKADASKKEKESQLVDHYIKQCRSGIDLVSSFTDISVIQREALPKSDFYRNYDLTEFGGKIMVKPEDFMSEEDKERDAKFLMYFQQDADYIYYASYSEKNATGKDLYVIQKLPTGGWSQSTKLSTVINTAYDEDYPFIHPDGNVLYFASKGHNSMGGYDIFKSTRNGDGTWTRPINMEFAINTPWDDYLFISDKGENIAWFASNRETNSKQVTVYKIGIERVPLDLTLIKGTFEADGSKRAKITVEDMVQNKVVGVFESERQFGEYLLDIRGSGKYKFIVEAEESNAVHTGLVEIPREKGLKQFSQEMKLVNENGKEQLQIINHFDEPLSESLLTADILKKQASLSINSSEEDIVRSTEILDDESLSTNSPDAGLSKEEKLAKAGELVAEMEANASLMNKKATLLLEKAQEKAGATDAAVVAEAAIAAELAHEYKTEADKREAAARKMSGTLGTLDNASLEEAAFNAQYNQLAATSDNFEPIEEFETMVSESFESRKEPSVAIYESKQAEFDELNDDITSIDEEIAYYSQEIENTKDEALKEEFQLQKDEAASARPEKEASLDRVKAELESATDQKNNAESYAGMAASLLTTAAEGAEFITTTSSVNTINQLQTELAAKAAGDPALVAFIAPESAKEATELALAESRKNQEGSESSNETAENITADDKKPDQDTSENTESPESNVASSDDGGTSSTEVPNADPGEPVNSEGTVEETAENNEVTSTVSESADNTANNPEDSQKLNEEIRTIEGTESTPDIVGGDYSSKLQQQINEAANAEDPIIAESRKAEIYDQWVDNIEYRIDSLEKISEASSSEDDKLALANKIQELESEKQQKSDMAMKSYEAIAELSDREAISASATEQTAAASEIITEAAAIPESADDTQISADGTAPETVTETNDSAATKSEEPLIVPPVTPELLASEDVPPSVSTLNTSFTERVSAVTATANPIADLQTEAAIYEEWSNELQKELNVLAAQKETVENVEDRNAIDRLSARVAELNLEKKNKAAELKSEISKAEKESLLAEDNANLQRQMQEYVETYNSNAFVQLDEQIANNPNPELVASQTKILNQNWMVAIKNEELKTETRIKNSTDPNQKAELEEKLVNLNAEKLYVQATLDSINATSEDGPAAPKSVVVKGSEKFEGYIPVATEKPQEYDQKIQTSYNSITTEEQEVAAAEAKLTETKKKKLKAIVELEVEKEKSDLVIVEMESKFYEDAVSKIQGVEPLILQLEPGDPTPSQKQMQVAQKLEEEAAFMTTSAAAQREKADAIRKKKVRIPAQKEAYAAENLALLKRKEADLASQLANEMATIEARAIAENYIIPEGTAIELPVVSTPLNPTEREDVVQTEQFISYNVKRKEADSLRMLGLKLATAEAQLNEQAQQTLMQAGSGVTEDGQRIDRMKTAENAYVLYDRADSLSAEAARLNRQAAFVENAANEELLQNPEEVYNAIIAYYQTDTNQRVILPTTEDIADLVDTTGSTVIIDEPTPQEDEPFDLNPPTEDSAPVAVQEDVLTNTIFEVNASSDQSFYSTNTPIPVDKPLPSGILFKVQIGAFRNEIRQDAFKGIKPIFGESVGNGLTRYTAGSFNNFAEADLAKDEIRGIGYSDAFVVAYQNGKRISVSAARAAIASGNTSAPIASTTPRTTQPASLPANSVVKQGPLVIQDVANNPGPFYTVQVGVYSRPVSARDIYNISPLNQENLPNGTYRYSSGVYSDENIATKARDEIRTLGISDAFVTAYKAGTRITVDAARSELGGSAPVETPQVGGQYTVSLGSFTGAVPVAEASIILSLSSSGVEKVSNADGSHDYFYGSFSSQAEAEAEAAKLVARGLTQSKAVQK